MPSTELVDKDLLHVTIGETLAALARAIADAQKRFDESSFYNAEVMSGTHPLRYPNGAPVASSDGKLQIIDSRVYFGYEEDEEGNRVAAKKSMLELGFAPRFYKFMDTVIEMRMAMRLHKRGDEWVTTTTPVDGSYAAAYGFDTARAGMLTARIEPIPPPPIEERLLELLSEKPLQDLVQRFDEAKFDKARFSPENGLIP